MRANNSAIILKPIKMPEKVGEIVILQEYQRYDADVSVGQILSIGSLALDVEMYHEKEFGITLDLPAEGDYVMCAKRSGYEFKSLGQEYRVVLPADILAIITEEEANDMVSWIRTKENAA